MAYLLNLSSNEKCYLRAHHTFGRRSELVDTFLKEPEISKIHASIEWNGQQWLIRSLGRNGTWLDGEKLTSAVNTPLVQGQKIRFANSATIWQVQDLDVPSNILIGLNPQSETQTFTDYHLLPNLHQPQAALYFCPEQDSWVLETIENDQHNTQAINQPIIKVDKLVQVQDYAWSLLSNNDEPETQIQQCTNTLNDCVFRFNTSLDEEHTLLSVDYQDQSFDLGERSHHYLLLHLARIKKRDADNGFDITSQGWISNERLSRELGIDINHINILIFRAKKQLADKLPKTNNNESIIERRRGSLRFNGLHAHSIKGELCEHLCH